MPKRCSCGIVHAALPPDAVYHEATATWYFNCSCHSTLCFVPDWTLTRQLITAATLRELGQTTGE